MDQKNRYFLGARKGDSPLFLAFLAARFSFKLMAGFFLASLLLLRSLLIIALLLKGINGIRCPLYSWAM